MRRYKLVYVKINDGWEYLIDALDKGWKIERADAAADFIVYILYKEAI